ncbi:4-hydroxy-3-methylbut-2-enyl diphosphate reductase [Anaerosphaera aminiphila DSM 21120]|uniref:4-hydroxy-3-methylbut-2-enyl diphosphate reductase n=1 Tax=Anaerosphaera aminiphila DSM 21120 TaxID=1120995 RepID=A0A1M5P801_9FIRM|nr:4-hydroxy-3-methylbut-2-enyl diphosphate reductase [Anaerosphaera aminiphila DSM 21120]
MKKIEVKLAKCAGFCGGVKRAVILANKSADSGVYCLGDLVHNSVVMNELLDKGVKKIYDIENIKNSKVIIRSHGVHREIIKQLEENNNEIVDCVCKKVSTIYDIVNENYREGYNIIIFGDKNHPEVIAINSHCDDSALIIGDENEPLNLPEGKLIIVSQTTNNEEKYKKLINRIKDISKDEVLVYNTICSATKNRQQSASELAKEVDAMIVLGGKNSSNTKKLFEVSKKYCENVYLIESIKDFNYNILKKFNKIGITAGASTPDSVIKEAVSSMENFGNNEMMEAIENTFKKVRRGEVIEGEVLFVNENEVMVNIGYRSDGIISKEELSSDPNVTPSDLFKPGDKIQVYIMKMDDGDGNVVLSHRRIENIKVWDEIEEKFNNKERVTVKVKSVVKGGLTADLDGLNAFIPASHVSIRFQRDLTKYVGQELLCEIIDFDKSKRKIVLSRKMVEVEELEEKKKAVYESIHEGDIVEGVVQRLTNFGAFIDLGGVDGLIHISELSWNRVKHPSDVVTSGQHVKVQVLSVDEEKNRIALGLKQTTEKPWDTFISNVKVGDVVEGKVVNLLDFGAFVRLESGVDGLLHVSQISREHVEKPADKLAIGDEVTVKVTDIDEENKKVSLSMKALLEDEPSDEHDEETEKVETKKPVKKVKEPTPTEINNDDSFNTTIGDLFNINIED